MTTSSIPRQSAVGFIVASVIIAVGVYFGTKLAGEKTGIILLRLFYVLATVTLLKSVFAWGEARGFPIRRENGRIDLAHLFRNLIMAVVAAPVVLAFSAPLSLVAFQLAR